jgi:predicted ATPase/class 3 adenylate cyclase
METVLFTDIEGSTRLWEEHGEAMAAALARHDGILANSIQATGGRVLKTTGDGFIAIFESPAAAVACAASIQGALAAQDWKLPAPIRVRMGVHAGETESRADDYFGPTMNRAARIMAAGHGGQILLSGTVAALVEQALPAGAALRDLGSHRLKDLTRPEHLYQLLLPDLQSEFPALRTLDGHPGNLPLQATEFIGRVSELAAIEALIESPSTRLLTITGPGGTGKTRLALQAAADLLEAFRDGVFFIDLSAERASEAAFEAIVRTLGLTVSGNGGTLDTLKVRLRDKQVLLLLDNFEQVMSAAAGVSELLQHLPDVKIVITSRESLRVRAERLFPVPPLSLPGPTSTVDLVIASEAVQLFEERGRAVLQDFAVTPENARAVAAICERLDGLPLAIELAAARLRLFTPADLLVRLRDRLDVTGSGSRDLPDRQRTLWGAIDWSYDLLSAEERTLFGAMSVFAAADLAALETVGESALGGGSILDPLESLVDKSLVQSHDEGPTRRFWMLQTVREYAAQRLATEPDLLNQFREAHARHFLLVVQRLKAQLHGPQQHTALSELEADLGNLKIAWQYWLEQGDVEALLALLESLWALHAARGWYHSAIELTRAMLDALARSGRASDFVAEELGLRTDLARALMAVGGYNIEVEAALNRALELAEAGGTGSQGYPVLRALASIYTQRTSWEAATTIGHHLVTLGEREGNQVMLAEGHYVIGANTLFTDPFGALAELDEAVRLFGSHTPTGERLRLGPSSAVLARTASALMLWMTGALDRAVARMDEALAFARDIDHPYTVAYALYHCGFLAINRGRFEDCREYARELREVSEAHDYPIWATLARLLEGVATAAQGNRSGGLAMTERAVELYQGLTPPPVFWPFILMIRAAVYAMAGQPEMAVRLLEEARAVVGALNLDPPELRAMIGDIMRMLPQPDVEAIESHYLAAIEIGNATGLRLGALTGATGLVTLRRQLGRTPDGSAELREVVEGFTEGRDERPLIAARELLGAAMA